MAAELLYDIIQGWNIGGNTVMTATTGNVTPGPNCLLALMVSVICENTAPFAASAPSSSGTGPDTWIPVVVGTPSDVYVAVSAGYYVEIGATDPGTFTVAVSWSSLPTGAESVFICSLYKITDYDTSDPLGGFVQQSSGGSGAQTATLSENPVAGAITIAQDVTDENTANQTASFASGEGWTTDVSGVGSGQRLAFNIGQRTGSTDPDCNWSSVNSGPDSWSSSQIAITFNPVSAAGPNEGDASGTIAWVGSSTGVRVAQGAGTGAIAWVGGADGSAPIVGGKSGDTAGSIAWVGGATGTNVRSGGSSGAIAWVGSATGLRVYMGSATGTIAWVGSAVGPASVRWPVSVDSTNRKLLDQAGDVYVMKGLSSWGMAMRLTHSEITTELEGWAALGFNTMNISIGGGVNSQDSWNTVQYKNAVGDNYWAGAPWNSALGPAWATVDHCQAECERLGMTMMMSFFLSYGATGIVADIIASTDSAMRTIGQTIATRYIDAPNIVWEIEVDDSMFPTGTKARRMDWLFRGITETELAPRLKFVEPATPGTAGYEYIANQGTDPTGYQWFHISADSMYLYTNSTVEAIESMWGDNPTYPVWDCEPRYAGRNDSTFQDIRERNYSDFIMGFCGINYGDEDWWPFDLQGLFERTPQIDWSDVRAQPESIEASYCWSIVDKYCKELTWAQSASFITTGQGSGDSKAAQGASDVAAMAYFPTSRTIVVDTTILDLVSVRLRWFDPTDNSYTNISSSEAPNASRSVTHPGSASNSSGDSDWLLIADQPLPPEGEATGAIGWSGAVSGSTTRQGDSSGAIAWVGSSTGVRTPQGAGIGFVDWVGTSTGVRVSSGGSTGTMDWVGTADGFAPTVGFQDGEAFGTISWVGFAVGGNLGLAIGAITWAGTTTSTRVSQGGATGAVDWVGAADGIAPIVGGKAGAGIGAINWVGAADGLYAPLGSVSGAIDWVGIAVGGELGIAIGSITWAGVAEGISPLVGFKAGDAVGAISWSGEADGVSASGGVAIGAIVWFGVVTSLFTVNPAVFLLPPHVVGYIPEIIVGHKPGRRSGR